MVIALAILLVCLSMLLIYALLCAEERHLKRRQYRVPPMGHGSKNNPFRDTSSA
jgi:hypothetical protein